MQMVTSTNIKQSQTTRDTKYKQARRLTTIIVASFIVLYLLFFISVTQCSALIKGNGAECVSASYIVECRDRLRCKVLKIASVTLSKELYAVLQLQLQKKTTVIDATVHLP